MTLFPPGTRVSGVAGAPNYRAQQATATVPAGTYASIRAHVSVQSSCESPFPGQGGWAAACDPFSRAARLTVAKRAEDGGTGTPLFLVDAMTPYGRGATYVQDVTDYAPFLVGESLFAVEVSTSADPTGAYSGADAGWGVEAFLELTPGAPPRDVVAVQPLFLAASYSPLPDGGVAPIHAELSAPAGSTSARVDFYATGHGAAGARGICDSFCPKVNEFWIDGVSVHSEVPWSTCVDNCASKVTSARYACVGRTFDYLCADNPTACPPSATYDRAGWCPGRKVALRSFTLPPALLTQASHDLRYVVRDLEGSFSSGAAIVYLRE